MAVEKVKELILGEDNPEIEGKFLVVTTASDGYFGLRPGDHVFKVEKTGNNYDVKPMVKEIDEDGNETMVALDEPIIKTDGKLAMFSANVSDPYKRPYIDAVELEKAESPEKAVLEAFREFAICEFKFGHFYKPFNTVIIDDFKLADTDTERSVPEGEPIVPETPEEEGSVEDNGSEEEEPAGAPKEGTGGPTESETP